MCGIFAALVRSGVHPRQVQDAAGSLAHRGPDGEGLWVSTDRRVALAHRRLSVIAPENGQQPVASESGRVRAVVNGEFYGFEVQRRELEQHGHHFSTESDSELAVHLYEDFGLDLVKHLRGEFAIVLWDEQKRQLIAIRDRFGVKPLVYSDTPGGVLIASEAKAIFAAGVTPSWDTESFFDAASMQYVRPDRTLFRGIRQVPPGCILVASEDGQQRIERYWEPPLGTAEPNSMPRPTAELIERCRSEVIEAVQLRLRADAKVCVQLSGGLDSSAVLGIAAEASADPVEAYSIAFHEDGYDERTFASEAADHTGVRWHPVEIRRRDMIGALGDAVFKSEGLCINSHLSAKYLLSKRMQADGVRVTLTGEGADEAFAGYGHLRIDHWRATAADDLIAGLAATNRSSLGMMLPTGDSLDLTGVRRRLGYVPSWMEAKATLGRRLHGLLRDDFAASLRHRDSYGEFIDCVPFASRRGLSNVDRSTMLWSSSALANYILATLGDGTEMAHSIEGRVPFLDHRLWEFLEDVPVDLKIHGRTEKHILREAVKPFVPDSIYRREKHPFDSPPLTLSDDPVIADFVDDALRSSAFRGQPFFDVKRTRDRITSLRKADETARLVWDPVIMTVLSTTFMQERFIECN